MARVRQRLRPAFDDAVRTRRPVLIALPARGTRRGGRRLRRGRRAWRAALLATPQHRRGRGGDPADEPIDHSLTLPIDTPRGILHYSRCRKKADRSIAIGAACWRNLGPIFPTRPHSARAHPLAAVR